jgi:hypothetical protein
LKHIWPAGRLSQEGCQPPGAPSDAPSGEAPFGRTAGFSGLCDSRECWGCCQLNKQSVLLTVNTHSPDRTAVPITWAVLALRIAAVIKVLLHACSLAAPVPAQSNSPVRARHLSVAHTDDSPFPVSQLAATTHHRHAAENSSQEKTNLVRECGAEKQQHAGVPGHCRPVVAWLVVAARVRLRRACAIDGMWDMPASCMRHGQGHSTHSPSQKPMCSCRSGCSKARRADVCEFHSQVSCWP